MNTREKVLSCITIGLFPLLAMGVVGYLMFDDFTGNISMILGLVILAYAWLCATNWHRQKEKG